jgi:hypothetical protein
MTQFDPEQFTLQVTWSANSGAQTEFLLSEVDAVEALMMGRSLDPKSFSSDCPSLPDILGCLARFGGAEAANDWFEVLVNGVWVVAAVHVSGGPALVPRANQPGVHYLAAASASWLPGGPCQFDQYEDLLRVDDLYWVDTSGDDVNQRVVAGRYDDEAEGLAAAVEASEYFAFDERGALVCELDTPQVDE